MQMPKKDNQIINPLKNSTQFGWHFEQNVYYDYSVIRALKSCQGSGNIPKLIEIVKYE